MLFSVFLEIHHFFNDSLKTIFRGIVFDSLQILIILTDKLSHLCTLVGSRDYTISNMSFSVAWKEFILLFILYEKYDRVIAFFIDVHTDAKQLLKTLAFLLKSETKFP